MGMAGVYSGGSIGGSRITAGRYRCGSGAGSLVFCCPAGLHAQHRLHGGRVAGSAGDAGAALAWATSNKTDEGDVSKVRRALFES